MNIAYGNLGVLPVECTDYKLDYWRIRWDFDESAGNGIVKFKEYQFEHKPTIDEVKSIIESDSEQVLHDWSIYERYLTV